MEKILTLDTKKKTILTAYFVIWTACLFIIMHYRVINSASIILVFIPGITVYRMIWERQNFFEKYKSRGFYVYAIIISIVYAFCFMGRPLFLTELRMNLSIVRFVEFILISIALFPTIFSFLWLLEAINGRMSKKKTVVDEKPWKIGVTCGLTVFLIDFIISLAWYPCTMTGDSIGHWQQALGQITLTDYNPIIYILFLRFLFRLTGNTTPFIYCVFQNAMFAIGMGDFACFLRRKGVAKKWLIIGSVVMALIPSTYLLELYVSKNPLTAIWAFWTVTSLTEMLSMPDLYLKRPTWFAKAIVGISGLYLTRANNAVILVPLLVMSIYLIVKDHKYRKGLVIVAMGVGCLIGGASLISHQIEYNHVEKYHETIRPLVAPVGRAFNADINVPEGISEVAERVLSKEYWISNYNRFDSDSITYGTPRPQYANVSLKEAFRTYLKMLVLYPDLVIEDRLDGMNCVWNIGADRIVDIVRATTWLEGDVEYKNAKLIKDENLIFAKVLAGIKKITMSFYEFTEKISITDILFWRNGIWIVMMLMSFAYLVKNKRSKLIWAILPSLFILATYALVIGWQMYFYLWFFPLSVFVYIVAISINDSDVGFKTINTTE